MKNITKLLLGSSLCIVLLAGCKDWLDINNDPNYPKSASPRNVLPAAEMSMANQIGGYYNLLGGMWSQYWAQGNASNQYKYIDSYNVKYSDFNGQWNELYSGSINELLYIKKESAAAGNWSYYLMATVLECYTWQVLVDLYDQIPFNEANKGVANLAPHYDNAQLVYDSLIVRLNYALSKTLNDLDAADKKVDLVFTGDMDKWIQFANTLKLKIYMRQMYVRPTIAQNGIEKLYTDGVEFLDQDAAITCFIDASTKDNPLYSSDKRNLNTATNIRISATLWKYMKSKGDARLDFLGETATGKTPIPQGGFDLDATTLPSNNVSVATLAPTDNVYFMSLPEIYFLQAEAIAMGWGTGNDKTMYDNGVVAAFARFGLSGSSYVAAGGAYEYPVAGTFEQKQEAIIMAKWASMARAQGLEAFLETNRTHYPKAATALNANNWNANTFAPSNAQYMAWAGGELLYSLAGKTSGLFPKRLPFPKSERDRNSNTPTEVSITTKVWWDVKP